MTPETRMNAPKAGQWTFINVSNPEEIHTRALKRNIRSHVAHRQHHPESSSEAFEFDEEEYLSRFLADQGSYAASSSRGSTTHPSSLLYPATTGEWTDLSSSRMSEKLLNMDFCERSTSPIQQPEIWRFPLPVPYRPVYDQILEFYVTKILIDTPASDSSGQTYNLRSDFLPFVTAHATTFHAALAFASARLRSQHPALLSSLAVYDLRSAAINAINDMLPYGASDKAVVAVFLMSLMESMHGEEGDRTSYHYHMDGLVQLVALRGGLEKLGLKGLLARMIRWLDFYHAETYEEPVKFWESSEMASRSSPWSHPRRKVELLKQER